jgi:hypothetical protein
VDPTAHTLLTYLFVGVSLAGYDWLAPPLHRKLYVSARRAGPAVQTWFFWPIVAAFDIRQEWATYDARAAARYAAGVAMLWVATYLWLRVFFLLPLWFIGWRPLSYFLAVVAAFVAAPLITTLVMPKHGAAMRRLAQRMAASPEDTPVRRHFEQDGYSVVVTKEKSGDFVIRARHVATGYAQTQVDGGSESIEESVDAARYWLAEVEVERKLEEREARGDA